MALLLGLGAGAFAQAVRVRVEAAHLSPSQVERVTEMAGAALLEAETGLRHAVAHPVRVVLVARVADLDPDIRPSFAPWTVAVTRLDQGDVFCVGERVGSQPPDDLRGVLDHEMVHVVLGDLERSLAGGRRRLPRWLHEGLAQDLAGYFLLGGDESAVEFAARTDRLLAWNDLEHGFPPEADAARKAYAQSASFVAFLRRTLGLATMRRAIDAYLRGEAESLDVALDQLGLGSFTERTGDWTADLRSPWRAVASLGRSCSTVVLLLGVPLLGLVLYKRHRRERRALARLEAWEAEQDALRAPPASRDESA